LNGRTTKYTAKKYETFYCKVNVNRQKQDKLNRKKLTNKWNPQVE